MAAYDDDAPYHQQSVHQMSTPITPDPQPITPPTPSSSGLFAEGVKEGWVLKKGPKSLQGWKKRYLQLSRNKHLAYYTDESMVKRKGTVFLNALTIHHIQRAEKTSDSKHHGFSLLTSGRTYHFCVGSAADRDHWIQKIREVVDEHWDAHKISKTSISMGHYPKVPQRNKSIISGNINHVSLKPGPKLKKASSAQRVAPVYNEWDDDDEEQTKGVTLAIQRNMLQNKEKNKNNTFDFNENKSNNKPVPIMTDNAQEEEEWDTSDDDDDNNGFKHRKQQNAQKQIDRLQDKNDKILDQALQTSYETQQIATNTAQKLDEQRNQLINVDKNLHEIDQDLDKTEGILDGMKSIKGMIKNKLMKNDKAANEYNASIDNKSTFERKENGLNHVETTHITQEHEADNKQNDKLDELLHNIKGLNQQAHDINTELNEQNVIIDAIGDKMDKVTPQIQQQNKTMKKICD